jgi:hypothetical protein
MLGRNAVVVGAGGGSSVNVPGNVPQQVLHISFICAGPAYPHLLLSSSPFSAMQMSPACALPLLHKHIHQTLPLFTQAFVLVYHRMRFTLQAEGVCEVGSDHASHVPGLHNLFWQWQTCASSVGTN